MAGAAGAAEVGGWRGELAAVLAGHPHPGERVLLERLDACLGWLGARPAAEAAAVRRVVATIISGQRLDLLRFGAGDAARPVALTAAADPGTTVIVAEGPGNPATERLPAVLLRRAGAKADFVACLELVRPGGTQSVRAVRAAAEGENIAVVVEAAGGARRFAVEAMGLRELR